MSNYLPPSPTPPPQFPGYGTEYPYARNPYAHWIKRVAATLVDGFISLAGLIPLFIGMPILFSNLQLQTEPDESTSDRVTNHTALNIGLALMLLGFVLSQAVGIWNQCYRQGKTGQSLGKKVVGITTVKEDTGQPLGGWLSLGRQFLHIADSFFFSIGYLWPLWDDKRQTFADKIVGSVVLDGPPEEVIPRQVPIAWAAYPGQQEPGGFPSPYQMPPRPGAAP